MVKEIIERKEYLEGEKIESIYFGGGTPSLLKPDEIKNILAIINSNYKVNSNAEITLEANPDDLSEEYISQLKKLGINRLSIGIQSFNDEYLQFLNRRHTAKQAVSSIKAAKKAGIGNISIDLIYGTPGMHNDHWKKTLDQTFHLDIQHISAYHLTIEKNTVLSQLMKLGKIKELDEHISITQFEVLVNEMCKNGFIHYEISNFGKRGYFSIHNTNYWKNKRYIGIGPSAHSYDLDSRQWNVSNVTKYIKNINNNQPHFEKEKLNNVSKYNDYVITSLRTMWGINMNDMKEQFGDKCAASFRNEVEKKLKSGVIEKKKDTYSISKKGMFIADSIIRDVMIV